MAVKKGSKVKVEYTGSFDDGTVFDSSKHGDHQHPLEFEAGSGQVVAGFDKAIIGMNKGEEKEFRLEPEEAYGQVKPELVQKIPRKQLPPEVKQGMLLGIQLPNGAKIPAKVNEVTNESVTLDLNHPLAGKALNFKIKIVEIN
jgi:FKBP-type peptidyl-prolyl cis-trans isomerase 2